MNIEGNGQNDSKHKVMFLLIDLIGVLTGLPFGLSLPPSLVFLMEP